MTNTMRSTRRHCFALVAASLALVPAAAIGANVDAQTTAALVLPDRTTDRVPDRSLAHIVTLKSGLDALSQGRAAERATIRDGFPKTSLDRHILAWAIAMKGGDDVPSADIAAASAMLKGWPAQARCAATASVRSIARSPSPEKPSPPSETARRRHWKASSCSRGRIWPLARSAKRAPCCRRSGARRSSSRATNCGSSGSSAPSFRPPITASAWSACSMPSVSTRLTAWRASPAPKRWPTPGRQSFGARRTPPSCSRPFPPRSGRPAMLFAKAKLLRRQKKFSDAAAIMLKAPTDRAAVIDPDAWWVERRVLSRELVDHGDMKTAYRIAAAHAAESPANAADAEFHAGWYAFRGLNDPKTGAKHFARIAEIAEGADLAVARLLLARPRRRGRRTGRRQGLLPQGRHPRHDLLRPACRGTDRQHRAQCPLPRAVRRRPG